jgi:hypothetical protein
MNHLFRIIVIAFLFAFSAYPKSFSSDSLEKMIATGQYSEAKTYVDTFQPKNTSSQSEKEELQSKLNYLLIFYKSCDSCDSIAKVNNDTTEVFKCYKEILYVASAGIEDFAFSNSMAHSVSTRKNEIVQKYNTLVPIVNRIAKDKQAHEKAVYDSLCLRRKKAEDDEFYRQVHFQDSISKYRIANDSAENRAEREIDTLQILKEMSLSCSLCRAYLNKTKYESAIEEERAYSNKYGITNLSKIDGLKQRIISCDKTIRISSKEYFTLKKRRFNYSKCKDVFDCDYLIDSLRTVKIDSLREIYIKLY